jgi:beta-glucanase (GH16 family)
MAFLSSRRIKSSLALIGLTALLAACGGSIEDGGAGAASSPPSSLGTHLAAATRISSSNETPSQTAPPAAGTAQTPASSPSFASTHSIVSSSSESDGPTGQDASEYTLTFHDDFDGELNRDVWNTNRFEVAAATTNYAIRNGTLKIWPERGSDGEFFDRTLDTDGRFLQRYGYFEIEARLPKGQGVWPAFWLFNQIGERRPEIDIMEAYPSGLEPWGAPGPDGVPVAMMYAPVVWTDGLQRAGYAKVVTPDLSADFHRYGVKWEPNRVTFYFDGREVYSLDVAVSDPLYIILDLWFGSSSGEPDDRTPTGESNSFEINYVKAWQFK